MRTFLLIAGAAVVYAAYQYFFADDQDDRPPQPPVPQRDPYERHWQSRPPQPPVHRRDPYERHFRGRPVHQRNPYERHLQSRPPQPPVHRGDSHDRHWQSIDSADGKDDRPPQPPVHQRDPCERHWQNIGSADAKDDRPPQPPVHQRDPYEQQGTLPSQGADIAPEDFTSLRARAKEAGDLMSRCYTQSQEAYDSRDHVRARALSDMGKRHALEVEILNAKASAIIYNENNRDRDASKVDLHRLSVKEAIAYSEKAVTAARQRGYSDIRLIVGKGNHSENGISRLKPALQVEMEMRGYHVEADPNNSGVLVVRLGDSGSDRETAGDEREITSVRYRCCIPP